MTSGLDQHYLELDGCWACGAPDGAHDAFLDQYSKLCFSEPMDPRFGAHLGFQMMCSACIIGRVSDDLPTLGTVKNRFIVSSRGSRLTVSVRTAR
jgi:hypothetical protein